MFEVQTKKKTTQLHSNCCCGLIQYFREEGDKDLSRAAILGESATEDTLLALKNIVLTQKQHYRFDWVYCAYRGLVLVVIGATTEGGSQDVNSEPHTDYFT